MTACQNRRQLATTIHLFCILHMQTHYAELGFHKERPKAIVPRDKILYATISQATHERTYANAGDQKRQGKCVHDVSQL